MLLPNRSLLVRSLPLLLFAVSGLAFAAVEKGEWTLSQSVLPDRLRFSIEGSDTDGGHFNSSSDWAIQEFKGLDWSSTAKHDVHFTINRDAGTIECDGFVQSGAGAGLFTFQPNEHYAQQMAALGFSGVTGERQFALALHDVSFDFARQIKDERIIIQTVFGFRLNHCYADRTYFARVRPIILLPPGDKEAI